MTHTEMILVLDFGSQYTQLIARRIRECGVYSEIKPFNFPIEKIKKLNPKGIILSGGPSSVYAQSAPLPERDLLKIDVPILGICYGLQLIAHFSDGKVDSSSRREYGRTEIVIDDHSKLFYNLADRFYVWMSHGDHLTRLPSHFHISAHTDNSPIAAIHHASKPIFGIQFHPEVVHTQYGFEILKNFVFHVCKCKGDWTPASFIETTIRDIQNKLLDDNALCALSGGVDSTVAAYLVGRAIGKRLTCVFVDTGLLRAHEAEQVCHYYKNAEFNFRFVDSKKQFLHKLNGVTHPERKRKIIGNEFIRVFEKEAAKIGKVQYLIQGTLYPDVIESVSTKGPSATIKTHHNVGGLPEKMSLKLIEPLRELFKDEVRVVGKALGVPEFILERHPFPGPGLAVRILGEINEKRLEILRPADSIFIEELKKSDHYKKIWQAFAVLLPVQTVGVMGDERTYENVIALRAVTSQDGMTADWAVIPDEILAKISNRIINEVTGVNRVVYDISSKPPSTIEWE
jgi:GMP synthase (glutamine-hydrolysing)